RGAHRRERRRAHLQLRVHLLPRVHRGDVRNVPELRGRARRPSAPHSRRLAKGRRGADSRSMGARRWIAAVVVVAVVGIAGGWVAWPHGHSASAAPFTAEFGVPRLGRTTGRVSASGSITNVLSVLPGSRSIS